MNLTEAKEKWAFLLDAYNASGGFSDGGYLVKFPREVDEKFLNRKKIAFYVNYTAQVLDRFSSYLFKKKPTRATKNELISLILDDSDLGKSSLDVFMQNIFKRAFLLGTGLVLVDMPKTLPKDLKSQKLKRAVPYLVNVSPLNLYDFSYKNGAFEWVILEYKNEIKKPFEKSEIVKEYHYWDAFKFEKRDKDRNLIESFEHNLGVCPLIALNLSDEFLGRTLCHEVSEISKRLYNARSELDDILRGQTFSILAYNILPEATHIPVDELKISTDNVLLYEGSLPEYISPSPENARIYMEQIKNLEAKIDEISLNPNTFSSKSQEAGIALKFKFEALNSALLNLSKKMEDFELRVMEVAFKWLNLKWDYSVSYASDFSVSDLKTDIEEALSLKELGMPSSWERAKKRELARIDLNGLSDDELNEIYDEISQEKELL